MAIIETEFDNEAELQSWVKNEFCTFLPASIILDGSSVTTPSGKRGIPDGFAFDFSGRAWYVIENELLRHGVWPHIAEQMVRFVVAMQNADTLRRIRDKVFEHVLQSDLTNRVANELGTVPERLLQQIELFIEGVRPHFVIFIDRANRDLEDMAHALDAPTSIFRVQKFLVDGKPDYHSPDRNIPVIQSEPEDQGASGSDFEIVEILGGGELSDGTGRFKCYKLTNGDTIHIKRSKYHERNDYYWYGITPSALDRIALHNVSNVVFVMGDYGFVKVPIQILRNYLKHTKTSSNSDGSIRHYHCLISHDAEPELYWSNDVPRFPLSEYFHTLNP